MSILLELFLTFAKIGLFTFGGGYAMISMIENNCVERKKWITHDECNCFGVIHAWKMNFRAGIITVILVAVMAGYKKLTKKKLSPILLIVIAAVAGVVVYGI